MKLRPHRLTFHGCALTICYWLAATLAAAQTGTVQSVGSPSSRDPDPPAPHGQGRSWVLLCNTANDFYPYEVNANEIQSFNYESGLNLNIGDPNQLALLLQDRDGFPAMALMAYETLRWQLGVDDRQITLMVFHDDEPGNSACETPITGGADNDILGDEWINWQLPLVVRNALFGPDGNPGTGDDPVIEYETLVVGQGSAPVTRDNLELAIQRLAGRVRGHDKVFLYLVDHGADPAQLGSGALYFEAGEATPADPTDDKVTGEELDDWLDLYFSGLHRPELLVVLADCCFAEALLQPLLIAEGNGEQHRVCVASSALDQLSWFHLESMFYPQMGAPLPVYPGVGQLAGTPSGSIFFWPFWNYVALGYPLQRAFDRAVNFAPGFFGGSRVLAIQRPVLLDRANAEEHATAVMASKTGGAQWRDLEWRPQGDYALVVGDQGTVWQYVWDPTLDGNLGSYKLVQLYSYGSSILQQVCWSADGSFAVAVGLGGLVLHVDHAAAPSLPAVSVVPPHASFLITDWQGCAAARPLGELLADGYDFVLVGLAGEIGLYDWHAPTQSRTLLPASVQGGAGDSFLGCGMNPLGMYEPAGYPCDYDRNSDETLIVGVNGAWRYKYTHGWRDPGCGQPTQITEQSLARILTSTGLNLRRVAWQPLQEDWALAVGWEFSGGAHGVLALHGANNQWTLQNVAETTALRDVDFKPDLGYVLVCGNARSWFRVPGASLGSYELLRADGVRVILGVDWRPTNSQATAAAALGLSGVVTSIEELTQGLRF